MLVGPSESNDRHRTPSPSASVCRTSAWCALRFARACRSGRSSLLHEPKAVRRGRPTRKTELWSHSRAGGDSHAERPRECPRQHRSYSGRCKHLHWHSSSPGMDPIARPCRGIGYSLRPCPARCRRAEPRPCRPSGPWPISRRALPTCPRHTCGPGSCDRGKGWAPCLRHSRPQPPAPGRARPSCS